MFLLSDAYLARVVVRLRGTSPVPVVLGGAMGEAQVERVEAQPALGMVAVAEAERAEA